MGYIMLLLFFLVWREAVKIRKACYDNFYENGKPPSSLGRLVNLAERVYTERRETKCKEKIQSNEPKDKNVDDK